MRAAPIANAGLASLRSLVQSGPSFAPVPIGLDCATDTCPSQAGDAQAERAAETELPWNKRVIDHFADWER